MLIDWISGQNSELNQSHQVELTCSDSTDHLYDALCGSTRDNR